MKPYFHLVLLARDMVGYKNLVKLSSLAYTEGFYSKPRVDRELLAKYNSQPTTQPAIVVPIAPVKRRATGGQERIRAAVQAKLAAPPPIAAVTLNLDKGPPPLAA